MNKRVLRTIAYIILTVMLASGLTGCGLVPSLNLTEEQSNLIAEYAAGKLIEYAKGHPGGLMILEDVDRADVNPGMKKEEPPQPTLPGTVPPPAEPVTPVQEGPGPEEGDTPPDPSGEEALVDAPEDVSAIPTKSIADALGINGAELTYDRYELASTYPENDTELAFSMKAAPGKELLIVHFLLTNNGDSDIEAYTDSSNFKVRLLVNGSDKLRGDVTFLDNDLMNYKGLLTPGAQVDAVLVFEVAEGTEVNSIDLLILEDGNEQKYKIM